MRLILIRHGRTIANDKRLYCGKSDLSLNEYGIEELNKIKNIYNFIDKSNSIFITSSLSRTKQTLKILFGDVKYISDNRIDELDFGDFELKDYNTLKSNTDYLNWIKNNCKSKIPNGESEIDIITRINDFLNDLFNKYKNTNKTIVLVTHGGSIYYIYKYITNTTKYIYEIQPDFGLGYIIDFNKNSYKINKIEREYMRKDLGKKGYIEPLPVLMISTYDEKNIPNTMNAAWGCMYDYNKVSIVLGEHKTTKNIRLKKAFVIQIATEEFVKECDYLGIESGEKVDNKLEVVKFSTTKSNYCDAPLIDQLPLAIECSVESIDEESGLIIGNIINTSCDEKYLDEKGNPSLEKIKPILYDSINHKYISFGKVVGNAFKDGLIYKK